ncbi:MAG: glycosyltransferase family 4 protein [Candidatus Rokubacteria bacterium]|nr:glycosyltransferase family 4 protein [Candidatus Rokubacteria bacterium]
MRVTVLSSTPASPTEGSGTFVATAGLVRGLADVGIEIDVRPLGRRTGFHTFDRFRYNVSAALRPPSADVVLGVDLDGFLWACRRRRPKFVVSLKGVIADEMTHERGWVRTLLGIQARWERANAHRADVVVASSTYAAETARRLYGLGHPVRTIPEPIDLAGWRARLAAAGARRPGPPTVLCVARMYPRKRIADLLHAARLLTERIPELRTRIVGKGPEYAALRDLSNRLALGAHVTFLGDVGARALAVEYVNADLFCLPSVQEAFGIVFAEAMAAGLPVVACRAAAVPEVVEHERTGLLVSPRRADELATAIERVVRDVTLRRTLGAAGTTRVEAFDLPRVARAWREVLDA